VGSDRDTVHAFLGPAGILFFFPLGRPATWRVLGMQPTLRDRQQEPDRPSLEEGRHWPTSLPAAGNDPPMGKRSHGWV
jgi:hypothetical protein